MILRFLIQFVFLLAEKEEQTPTFSIYIKTYQKQA